jgi:MOSC domain-containing protein YiiM
MTTITALYAGSLRLLEPEGHQTGIFKEPIEAADVTEAGIIGDHQADRRFHGGPEKALHQYALQSYKIIVAEYPQLHDIAVPGSIGENISGTHLTEATVCIGDIYQIGDVLLQVSQPRSPCWKINHKFGIEKLSLFIERRRITGWYYRVLEPGKLHIGDRIELVERPNEAMSVKHFLNITGQHRPNLEALDSVIMCEGLSNELKKRLKKRRKYLETAI